MTGILALACLVIVVIAVVGLVVLDKFASRAALERAAERQAFAAEREQWLQERQLLLNRIVDPIAGVAQSLVIGTDTFDPSERQEWPSPDYGQEMPDFPGQQPERTLT